MILLDHERLGCEQCIRGHRAADCQHLAKYLISIKGRGRPAAKDESIRFRVSPHPRVIKTTWEAIESKNGRGKSGTRKFCYHLDPGTPVELYKVKLGKGFKVIGPVTDFTYHSSFRVKSNADGTTENVGSSSSQMSQARIPQLPHLQPTATSSTVPSFPAHLATQYNGFHRPIPVKQESISPPTVPNPQAAAASQAVALSPSDPNYLVPPTPAPSPVNGMISRESSRVMDEMFEIDSRPSVSFMSSNSTSHSDLVLNSLQQHHQAQQQLQQPLTTEELNILQLNGLFDHEAAFKAFQADNSIQCDQPIHFQQQEQSQYEPQASSSANSSLTFQLDASTSVEPLNSEQTIENETSNNGLLNSEYFFQHFVADSNEPQWPSNFVRGSNDGYSKF